MRSSRKQMRKGLGKSPRKNTGSQAFDQWYLDFSLYFLSDFQRNSVYSLQPIIRSGWALRLLLSQNLQSYCLYLHNPSPTRADPESTCTSLLGLGRRLKNELLEIKRKGAKRGSQHYSDWTCARCQENLGRLTPKTNTCRGCNHLVCWDCRIQESNGTWRCKVCMKEMWVSPMAK